MNKLNKKDKDIRYKNYFLLYLSIIFLINFYLLFKTKDKYTFVILLLSLFTEIGIGLVLIFNKYSLLEIFHNTYFILLIAGTFLFKNIYLLFIVFIILIAIITRETFNVCLFSPYKKKTFNGTLSIIVLLIIIVFKIINEKMFYNLLKF